MDEPELISQCRKNDTRAQKALYDSYAMQMFILCRRYMKTEEQAEEVLMNGFLKFFQNLTRFEYRNTASLVAWLKKIMVNECLMELRKQHSFLHVGSEELPETACGDDVLQQMNADDIYKLILQLPIGYRTVFNMFALENYSHADIAKALSISEGTSKSQFHKARKQLQQMVIQQNQYYGLQQTK